MRLTSRQTNDEDRETKLSREFIQCIRFLNQALPEQHRLLYVGIDISGLNKKCALRSVAQADCLSRSCLVCQSQSQRGRCRQRAYGGSSR